MRLAFDGQGFAGHQRVDGPARSGPSAAPGRHPLTENGVVRIMAQPSYPNAQPAALVAARLAEACRHPSHTFWPAPISLLEEGLICWDNLLDPRQITDAYLLALAATRGGRFATFDQRVSRAVVPAASDANLCLIPCD
jgi:predicted nucleic acid-binding protein